MWRHIGDNPRYVQLDEVTSISAAKSNNASKPSNVVRHPLDWSSSSCGLFTGLLSLVALIINLIVYFALVNQVRIICRIPKKHSVWKSHKKVAFNIASEASNVYILSGLKFNKNAKNGQFWRVFENLKLAVKQCYQTGHFQLDKFFLKNTTFWHFG